MVGSGVGGCVDSDDYGIEVKGDVEMNVFNAIQFVVCGIELAIIYFQPEHATVYILICFGAILVLFIPQIMNTEKHD